MGTQSESFIELTERIGRKTGGISVSSFASDIRVRHSSAHETMQHPLLLTRPMLCLDPQLWCSDGCMRYTALAPVMYAVVYEG